MWLLLIPPLKLIFLNIYFVNFQKLVVKPDQLIKRRGKLGLIKVNVDLQEAKKWIGERMGKDIQVSGKTNLGKLLVIIPCHHDMNLTYMYSVNRCAKEV